MSFGNLKVGFCICVLMLGMAAAEAGERHAADTSFQTDDLDVRLVKGTEKVLITRYQLTADKQSVLVSSRLINPADMSGAGDFTLSSREVPDSAQAKSGMLPAVMNPVGCQTGCTLIDQYSHSTPLGHCSTAVTTTYVFVDDAGIIYTQNQTNIIRTPTCNPNN